MWKEEKEGQCADVLFDLQTIRTIHAFSICTQLTWSADREQKDENKSFLQKWFFRCEINGGKIKKILIVVNQLPGQNLIYKIMGTFKARMYENIADSWQLQLLGG